MKKSYLKKWLAMTLALTMTVSSSGLAVLAAEEPEEAAVTQEATVPAEESGTEAAEEEIAEDPEAEEEEAAVEETSEEAADQAEEEEETAGTVETEEEAEAVENSEAIEAGEADATADGAEADEDVDEAYADEPDAIEEPAEPGAQSESALGAAESVAVEAAAIEIAGKAYSYADVSGVPEGSEATITVDGKEHRAAEFTAIGDTGIVYYSADPLSGTLYGTDPAQVTSYTDFYSDKGVNAGSADYDVITSATNFSGFHTKDISPLIARSEEGITGIYDSVKVDAVAYVEASILKAAGRTLTAEQEKVIAVTLNEDPAADPEAAGKTVAVASSSYGYSCKYGDGEFIINPDDTVEGFVWSDYKNALYAATVSDGTNTTGAVWWIDLYGESATSGPHYNKVEIAVNNGTSKGSNGATVGRYASMYNSEKQELKAGTYTVTLYARGYNTVSTEIEVLSSFDGEVKAALSADKKSVELTGLDGVKNPKVSVTRTEGTGRNAKTFTYASGADVVGGKVALDTSENELVYAVYTVTVNSDNYAPIVTTFEYAAYSGYVLMNIPYSVFYGAEGATVADVDVVTSATDKVGNYTMTGGAYHTGKTADESGAAVGKANGAKVSGVIWPVKAETKEEVAALGGTEVKSDTQVTIAEAHHGQSSTFNMVGYEALVEQPAYSYYVLPEAPAFYMTLSGGKFSAVQGEAAQKEENEPAVTFGSNWGDVQIVVDAEDVSDKLVDAVILTADDGKEAGLYHLDQIWRGTQLAFKADVTEGLSGKTITNIRFYCMVKDTDTQDAAAPDYANYVYDYPVNIKVGAIYTGAMTAAFDSAEQITVAGLPEDAENVKAKVYTGRGADMAYLTPLAVDPGDGDIDPVTVDVKDGKIAITAGSATSGETTKTYGEPVGGTTYTIELSCDNYILRKVTAVYPAAAKQEQVLACDTSTAVVNGRTQVYTVEGAQGEITCEAADPSVVSVTVSGSKITVKGLKPGMTGLVVKAAETDDYEAAEAEFELRVVPGKVTKGEVYNLAQTMKITWEAVPGAKYYKVYRDGTFVASTSALVAYDKAKLVNGRKYTYKIVASTTKGADSSGDSPLSYSKTRCRLTNVDLKAPKNTAAGKATVNYNKAAVGDSYVIQWSEKKDMSNAKTKVIKPGSTTSYVIGGLKKGKTYSFQIRVRYGSDYTTFGTIRQVRITK